MSLFPDWPISKFLSHLNLEANLIYEMAMGEIALICMDEYYPLFHFWCTELHQTAPNWCRTGVCKTSRSWTRSRKVESGATLHLLYNKVILSKEFRNQRFKGTFWYLLRIWLLWWNLARLHSRLRASQSCTISFSSLINMQLDSPNSWKAMDMSKNEGTWQISMSRANLHAWYIVLSS